MKKLALTIIFCLVATVSHSAVTHDATTTSLQHTNSASGTFNHTVTGTNPGLFVCVAMLGNSQTVSSVKWDNAGTPVDLTQVAAGNNTSGNPFRLEVWALKNPGTGTKQVAVNLSGTNSAWDAVATSFKYTDTTTLTDGVQSNYNPGSVSFISLTPGTGNSDSRIYGCAGSAANDTNGLQGSPATPSSLWQDNSGLTNTQGGMVTGGSSQTYRQNWTVSGTAYSLIALNVRWDGSGSTPPVTLNAASCARADVLASYNLANDGDTVSIPAGDCDSTNRWSTVLEIYKAITIQGAGVGQTTIGLDSAYTSVFRIRANNVRITGISFDANNYVTTNAGIIMAGYNSTAACTGSIAYSDFRIDNCSFTGLYSGDPTGCLGCNAITIRGDVYGVIDSNTFTNCAGECIDVQNAGYYNHLLSNAPGQYAANHTVYIEDNTFNYNQSYDGENSVDSNSGARYVFRYNTINVTSPGTMNGITSSHDCSGGDVCNNANQEEAATALVEMYNNNIYDTAGGVARFNNWRSGYLYLYNNTIYYNDLGDAVQAYHLRAGHRPGCSSLEFRGYSEFCHEGTGAEGLSLNKTTLNGNIGNDTSCPTMTSVSGFPTYGGSIIVGTEQIDYTAISGNQLTPCTRGANTSGGAGARAAHSSGASINLLNFGICGDQQQASYIWNNKYKVTLQTSPGIDTNDVFVDWQDSNLPNYERYDIKSYVERPNNWQYHNDGTAYSYTPYTYPHPLRGEGGITPSQSHRNKRYKDFNGGYQ